MYVTSCRRCGETILAAEGEIPVIECAGETHRLCTPCYDAFVEWFRTPAADPSPELEGAPEAASR